MTDQRDIYNIMKLNFSAIKTKLLSVVTKSGNDIPFSDTDIFDHFEKIIIISQKYGIKKCSYKGKKHLDYVTRKLGINPIQAVLFSHFMERSNDSRIMISEIAKSIKCSLIRITKYMNECDELEKKKLIRCRRGDDGVTYRIPREVRESLQKFNEWKPEKIENITIFKFFTELGKIFKERENDELSYESMEGELLYLINQNMHLIFCSKIMNYKLDNDDLVLLILFCYLFWNNNDNNIGPHDIEFLYDDECDFSLVKYDLSDGCHLLMHGGYIAYSNDNSFANSESWKLSDREKKELLSEIKGNRNFKKNLILHDKINPKKMFYNTQESEAIQKLISMLREENYQKILDRLDGKGMRKGFACLFSGGPGTGKTETAYQIARETKRNIMMVDISEVKSMWYGESEKIIKEIFDTYRGAAENSEVTPILLFNEADAVIGKRRNFSSDSHSIDQTENTIQNIILQEMENLSGILIATTNLSQNMDSAFERRFLYKITFGKPNTESRTGIWNSLIPELPQNKAAELSGKYELSGGQIENIARKMEVDAIINGNDMSMDKLLLYCRDENENSFNTTKRIGF